MTVNQPSLAEGDPSGDRPISDAALSEERSADDLSDETPPTDTQLEEGDVDISAESVAGGDDSWRTTVSKEQQAEARELFQAGNALVRDSLFSQAAAKYEAALALWDHPGIHYNLALALLNLDQPLKLREHLIASLKYGEKSLGADKAKRVEQYLLLVEKQLAWLTVESKHNSAEVFLDGKSIFKAPGSHEGFERPGTHTVRATALGYEPTEKSFNLVPGQRETVHLKLYKPEDWIEYSRRWDVWGPIITTLSGVAVLATGGTLYGVGVAKVAAYDKRVEEECPDTGCAPGTIEGSADAGYRLQVAGAVSMSVGGAAALTGAVLLYMNRQIAHRVDPATKDRLSFTPVFSPAFAGFSTGGTF